MIEPALLNIVPALLKLLVVLYLHY